MMPLLGELVVLATAIAAALACNGYSVKDLKISMCDGQDELVEFENFSAQINEKCEVVPSGCIIFKKQINSGNATYLVEKKGAMGMPIKIQGKKEVCPILEKSKESPEIDLIFKMINMDQQCPIKEGKICGNGNVDIGKYKDQIRMMEGNFEGTIKANLDSGMLCIQFSLGIVKQGGKSGFPKFG